MREMRSLTEILNTVDTEDLKEEIQTSNKHKEMIKKGSNLDPKEVDKMMEVIQEYTVLQKACYILDDAIEAVDKERLKYKQLYESSKTKAEGDRYLTKWLGLTKEKKVLKAELDYYNDLRAKREDDVITYDKLLNSVLEKIIEREKKGKR